MNQVFTPWLWEGFRRILSNMKIKLNLLANWIKTGLAVTMLIVLTGCIGVVDDGGYSDGGVVVGGWGGWWGGGYDRGRDVHDYSARGAASRGVAHGGGGGGHASGGGGHGGGDRH